MKVKDIRKALKEKYQNSDFVIDKGGQKLVEIIGSSFIADEPIIFGTENKDYIQRELEWYRSMSLYVKDIPGKTPRIWEQVASSEGKINSNYGWCIFHGDNYNQYNHVLKQLVNFETSRRAIMIYTRPSIQDDYNKDGMSDFICTNSCQYVIRNNHVDAIVNMRSNDFIFGFFNDFYWHCEVYDCFINDFNNSIYVEKVNIGKIIWMANSLHVYDRHFEMIEKMLDYCKK